MPDFFYTWSKQTGVAVQEIERGQDDYFVLSDGRQVYDFISTSFQAAFGHSHAGIIRSMHTQLQSLPMAPPKATFPIKAQVTRGLIELLGMGSGKIFYTVSGAEAVENAVKMARRITGKPVVLSRQRSYHGASLGAMSISGDWRSSQHLNFSEGTRRIPEPDADPQALGARDIVLQVGADQIAAVIVETVSGTNGVIIPPRSWFEGLRQLCDEFGLFLILDEVLVGFYRCEKAFAFQHFDVRPDMVCMSKAITGGYVPMGAVWVNPKIADFYDQRLLVGGLTNYAHPVGLAAIGAVLQQVRDPGFLKDLREIESVFACRVQQLSLQHAATQVRRLGMLAAIEFGTRQLPPASDFWALGLHLYTRENMMILAPPLTTDLGRMEAAFDRLSEALG